MARFVPDASVTLTWCFEDETTDWSDALLGRLKASDEAIVPAHWPAEVINAALVAVRRGRISSDKATRFFEDLRALPIEIDLRSSESGFADLFALASKHGLSAYDAAYLELAIRMNCPLATLDGKLRTAASTAGVPLL